MTTATLEFLKELKLNNNREWFADNKPRYELIKRNLLSLSEVMISNINNFDSSLGFINPKSTIFRINRDIRFSKNKDPYKSNLGMVFNIGGNKHNKTSCYYIHIEPDDNSFLSIGIYMPDSNILKILRTHIDENWVEFQEILNNQNFKSIFQDLSRDNKVLKRAPIGFDINSPAIEYLKLTSFYVSYKITDKMLCNDKFPELAVKIFKVAKPLNDFINNCLISSITTS